MKKIIILIVVLFMANYGFIYGGFAQTRIDVTEFRRWNPEHFEQLRVNLLTSFDDWIILHYSIEENNFPENDDYIASGGDPNSPAEFRVIVASQYKGKKIWILITNVPNAKGIKMKELSNRTELEANGVLINP